MDLRILKEPQWWIGLPLELINKLIILDCLTRHKGNRMKTAKALNVSVRTVRNYINEFRDQGVKVPSPVVRVARPAKVKNRFNALGFHTKTLRPACLKLLTPLPPPLKAEGVNNVCTKHFYILPEGQRCPMCK